MKKSRKKITRAKITTVALCGKGKNGIAPMVKGDGAVCLDFIVKGAKDGSEILGVVYAPNAPDADGHEADPSTIEDFAHEYLRSHRRLDLDHDGVILSDEDAYVAESFIVAKGDERFADFKRYDGSPAGDLTGAWALLIKILNPGLRVRVAAGEFDGLSMFGVGTLEPVAKAVPEVKKMDEKQMAALVEALTKSVAAGLQVGFEALAKASAPAAPAPAKPEALPQFEGDVDDPEDVLAFEKAMRTHRLNKALAAGDHAAAQAILKGEEKPGKRVVESRQPQPGVIALTKSDYATIVDQAVALVKGGA
jgi:hypothetical protein